MTAKYKVHDFFTKIGNSFKKIFQSKLFTLTKMQLRDKVDLSWTKSFKKTIQVIIFGIVKFAVVFAITYLIILVLVRLGIFYHTECLRLAILMIAIMFVLSIISCTIGLVNSLYIDEDNKVLVTLPVNGGTLFFSKLIVYYLDELKKALFFTIPVIYACLFAAHTYIQAISFFWMVIPMLFFVAIPVLIGAILSIPAFFIKRLYIKVPVLQYITYLAIIGAVTYLVVKVILMIPPSINIIQESATYINKIRDAMLFVEKKMVLVYNFVRIIIGDTVYPSLSYSLSWWTLLRFVIMVAIVAALIGLAFGVTYPMFFYMMTTNNEFNKKVYDKQLPNIEHDKWSTFLLKELKLQFRDIKSISSTIITYIIVPVLILLMNKVFSVMDINTKGEMYSYFFNFLLITLPIFAANSKIASIYTIEGRAAYIKRTKPVKIYWALACKLFIFIIMSSLSIIASMIVFSNFTTLDKFICVLLTIGFIGFQVALIFFSAILDIIHPENEHYATVGNTNGNKNETKATIVAFIASFVIAFASYFLLNEARVQDGSYLRAGIEVLIIGVLCSVIGIIMFNVNVKGFYYDIESR